MRFGGDELAHEGRHHLTSLHCIAHCGWRSLKLPHHYPSDVVRESILESHRAGKRESSGGRR
jgi:hypothetical protein